MSDAEFPRWRRSVTLIAFGAGIASLSMSFWVPFLPLYMLELGAKDQAGALFWAAIALSTNGVFRIFGGPFWGMLADRFGRKRMFVRALYAATVSTLIAALATAPWHIAVAWACQGFFSGFIPAAIALTSVSVPPSRLTSGLGTVQGAQFVGTTVGPALGAVMAGVIGLRGAILTGALLPAFAATIVLLALPRDRIAGAVSRQPAAAETGGTSRLPAHGPRQPRMIGVQFALGLFLTFMIFATNDVVRTAAPVAIGAIQGHDAATGATGVAFTAAGLASVIGALGVARLLNRPGRMRPALALTIGVAAAAHVLLGLAGSVALFVIWFSVTSLARGAMMPATNTIIAASVSHERRGAAFGVASSAQALAFIIGPLGAALFAAISLKFGFIALGVMLAAGAALVLLILREPDLRDRAQPVAADQDHEERPGVGAPA